MNEPDVMPRGNSCSGNNSMLGFESRVGGLARRQAYFSSRVRPHRRITGLFLGLSCQNNTSPSSRMLSSQGMAGGEGRGGWRSEKSSPATTTHTHAGVYTPPEPRRRPQTPLTFTSDSFCWSLNTSFPFGLCLSPLSLRLLMKGTSMSSACIFARSLRFTSSSAYRSGVELWLHSRRAVRLRRANLKICPLLLLLLLLPPRFPQSASFAILARPEGAGLQTTERWGQLTSWKAVSVEQQSGQTLRSPLAL